MERREKSASSSDSSRGRSRGQSSAQWFINQHDQDNDGHLSRRELPSGMRSGFDRLDRNSDDYLSQSEVRQHIDRATESELPQALRPAGGLALASMEAVVLETDGSFSVITRSETTGPTTLDRLLPK